MDELAQAASYGLIRYDIAKVQALGHSETNEKRTQPSLVLKAYALALRSRITLQDDLNQSGQAIFVAGPQQKGIPIGTVAAYVNEQLYQLANAVQSTDVVSFNPGKGNYFEYLRGSDFLHAKLFALYSHLNSYVSMVKDVRSIAHRFGGLRDD